MSIAPCERIKAASLKSIGSLNLRFGGVFFGNKAQERAIPKNTPPNLK